MQCRKSAIPGVLILKPQIFEDERGFFMETYQAKTFSSLGISSNFVQENLSGSQKGVLRGLHYQLRQTQGKLVKVIAGEVFDVAVDLRRSSPTFGKWVGEYLSAQNRLEMWIPSGFAHGYYVLSDRADVLYKCTDFYAPQWERTIRWNDSAIGIDWPLLDKNLPILSDKDMRGMLFQDAEYFE